MTDELNKPSRGTGDWDIPLNQNFDTLEAAARAFLPRGTTQTLNVSDVNSDNITNSGTITSESVDPKFLADDYLYAGNFSGSDPDTRLTNALSSMNTGQVLQLENAVYTVDQTIPRRIKLVGTNASALVAGSRLKSCTWTFGEQVTVRDIGLRDSAARLQGDFERSTITAIHGTGEIVTNSDKVKIFGCHNVNVVLNGNTSVVSINTGLTVTDNGTGNIIKNNN
jgi:hypothetical protein